MPRTSRVSTICAHGPLGELRRLWPCYDCATRSLCLTELPNVSVVCYIHVAESPTGGLPSSYADCHAIWPATAYFVFVRAYELQQ